MIFSSSKCLLHSLHVFPFSRKGLFTQSFQLTMHFFMEARSRRTIEPLMCSDIIFGYGPITQPIARQTKDLQGGPSLGVAGRDPLGSTEGVPQHRILALLELQKWAGRLLQSLCRQQFALFRQEAPTLLLQRAGAQTGFEQSRIQQSQLTLGKPIRPDCSTATDLRAGHVPRPELRDRICCAA